MCLSRKKSAGNRTKSSRIVSVAALLGILALSSCKDVGWDKWIIISHHVTTMTSGGDIEPATASVEHGSRATFTLIPAAGYTLEKVTGCGGTLTGNRYTTGPVLEDCTVNATFITSSHIVTTEAKNGRIEPATARVEHGTTNSFTIIPDPGYSIGTVTGCDGTLTGNRYTTGPITGDCTVNATFTINSYTVAASAGNGGNIDPPTVTVEYGTTTGFTITPALGYSIGTVTGCSGTLSGNRYTTGPVTGDCTVNATFTINSYTVAASAGNGGNIDPPAATVEYGATTNFTVTPDQGYSIDTVTGCGGNLVGDIYTTSPISGDCTVTASFIRNPPVTAATPSLTFVATKIFRFDWSDVGDATFYRLLEDPDGNSGYTQVSGDLPAGIQSFDLVVPLYARVNARYILQSCNEGGCTDSAPLVVNDPLTAAIGYFKASNTNSSDWFGESVSLSRDGRTLAVGASGEDSNATGINGDQNNSYAANSGAVYVFVRNGNSWSQQAFIKASNTGARDGFGSEVSLSDDGNTLAVSAPGEDSGATGVNGNQNDDSVSGSGAVYIFTRTAGTWSQQAYLKASNPDADDSFGNQLSLSGDGNTLAVAAWSEDSAATGIDGDGSDNSADKAGAVYVFTRTAGAWSQQAYIKSNDTAASDRFGVSVALDTNGDTLAVSKLLSNYSGRVYIFTRAGNSWSQQASFTGNNTTGGDWFGKSLSLSGDGNTLAIGAYTEDSGATGINGNGSDNSVYNSGAAYIFTRNGSSWGQAFYIKSSNPGQQDWFGAAVALSRDGNLLVVGAPWEDGGSKGLNGDQSDDSVTNSGAAYLFRRDGAGWRQEVYVKANNTGSRDRFGAAISLSSESNTLAIGALYEKSIATGINNDPNNDLRLDSGAVYLY